MTRTRGLALGWIVALLLGPTDTAATAIGGARLAVGPAVVEQALAPGGRATTSVTVTNAGPTPVSVRLSEPALQPTSGRGRRASPRLRHVGVVSVEPHAVSLTPGEQRAVSLGLEAPSDAEPGGHYTTVFFTAVPPPSQNTRVAPRVGAIVLLDVHGHVQRRLVADGPVQTTVPLGRPDQYHVRIHNVGNTHVLPTGAIVVRNLRGRTVARLRLRGELLLPGTTQEARVRWDRRWPAGRYAARAEVDYGPTHITVASERAVFWALPWPAVPAALVLGGALHAVLLVTRSRRARRQPQAGVEIEVTPVVGQPVGPKRSTRMWSSGHAETDEQVARGVGEARRAAHVGGRVGRATRRREVVAASAARPGGPAAGGASAGVDDRRLGPGQLVGVVEVVGRPDRDDEAHQVGAPRAPGEPQHRHQRHDARTAADEQRRACRRPTRTSRRSARAPRARRRPTTSSCRNVETSPSSSRSTVSSISSDAVGRRRDRVRARTRCSRRAR